MASNSIARSFCLWGEELDLYDDLFHTMDGPGLTEQRIRREYGIFPLQRVAVDIRTDPPDKCTCQGAKARVTVYVYEPTQDRRN